MQSFFVYFRSIFVTLLQKNSKKKNNKKQLATRHLLFLDDKTLEGPPSTFLTMVGIYEKTWFEDEEVYSFAVITVDASDDFSWLHHRMPALSG